MEICSSGSFRAAWPSWTDTRVTTDRIRPATHAPAGRDSAVWASRSDTKRKHVCPQGSRRDPGFRAGLKAGDHITHIGKTALTGLSQRDVITKLRGPIHSGADLTISREASLTPVKITVIRAHIILPTIESKLENGILKIEISGFNQGTSRSLGKALSGAERGGDDVKGVILDLRGNPGGLLDQAVAVADFFLNDGRIISTRGRHHRANQIYDASWGERVHNLPIVVLINGRSASASEIVAAALRDRGRAVVVGASSYGKGSVQTISGFPTGANSH